MSGKRSRTIVLSTLLSLVSLFILPTLANAAPRQQVTSAAPIGEIAYVRDGNLWLLDLSSGQSEAITTDGNNSQPAWSPDGRYLLYTHKAEWLDSVYIWDAQSKTSRQLVESACCAAWAPNGDRIAYVAQDLSVWTIHADGTGAALWFADLLYGKGSTITGNLDWPAEQPETLIVPHEMLLGAGMFGFGIQQKLLVLERGGQMLDDATGLARGLCASKHLARANSGHFAVDYAKEVDCEDPLQYPKGILISREDQQWELPWLAYPTLSADGAWLVAEAYTPAADPQTAALVGLVLYDLAQAETQPLLAGASQPAWRPLGQATAPAREVTKQTGNTEADAGETASPPPAQPDAARAVAADVETGVTVTTTGRSNSIMFMENMGQFDEAVQYYMWGSDAAYLLTADAFWITLLTPEKANTGERQVNLKFAFTGANPKPRLEPFDRLETNVAFFTGNDPAQWHRSVPAWGGVRYVDLYPGIDLEITSRDGRVHQRLIAAETADLGAVRVTVAGADDLTIDADQLHFKIVMQAATAGQSGVIDYASPHWQVVNGDVRTGRPALQLQVAGQRYTAPLQVVSNAVGSAATQQPTAADPPTTGLLYSTLLGSSGYELGDDIAVDRAGNAYVVGSTSFQALAEAPGIAWGNSSGYKVIAKLDPTGGHVHYLAFLTGGASFQAIAVDDDGQAYITGYGGPHYPTTPGAYRSFQDDEWRELAYVTKLTARGDALLFSTFLSNASSRGIDLALDGEANIYVTGSCNPDFPTTAGTYDVGDAIFVVKLTATGDLLYSACFGGSGYEQATAIAVDLVGNVYLTGNTGSQDFPITAGAFDGTYNGGDSDAFILKLNADGSALDYSTFLGGDGFLGDSGREIAVDAEGHVYVAGDTAGAQFPTTVGAHQPHTNGLDAFAVKLSPDGSRLLYSTLLGGDANNNVRGMALDQHGYLYLTGHSNEKLATTANAFDRTYGGGGDAFLLQVSPTGDAVPFSTYLGGSRGRVEVSENARNSDIAYGLTIDGIGDLYVAGYTYADDFPTTPGAFSRHHGGRSDIFVTKVRIATEPQLPAATTVTTTLPAVENPATTEITLTVLVDNLNIRSGPGTNYAPISQADTGDVFTVVGQNADGAWYEVCCVAGEAGWVTNDGRYVTAQE